MRLPIHAADLLGTGDFEARGRLEGKLGRRPTIAEIAEDLGLEEHRVAEIIRYIAEPMSLFRAAGIRTATPTR